MNLNKQKLISGGALFFLSTIHLAVFSAEQESIECYENEVGCLSAEEAALATPGVAFDGANFLDMRGNPIIDVKDPVDPQDVATKAWTLDQFNGIGDNLGNHTATSNINLNGHWLSGDGSSTGININSAGNVGIGTSNPAHKLQIEGGNIAMGWERLQTLSHNVTEATQPCSSEKYVIGGGCACDPQTITLSAPINSLTWACRCSAQAENLIVYAICANIR